MAGGWAAAAVLAGLVLFGLYPYVDDSTVPVISQWVSVTYGSFHRIAWLTAVGWLIFACAHGYGGCMTF